MQYSWDWLVIFKNTGVGQETYLDWVLTGVGWLMALAIVAWTIAMLVGTVLGVMRTLPNRILRTIASSYVNLFRNVPLLVQLFVWYYIFPYILPDAWQNWWFRELHPETSAYLSSAIGLGLFTAARICEQVRTGIDAISRDQGFAAYSLGFTLSQKYRYVLLPQAFRIILPPLGSEVTNCFKNASVASLVGAAELISQIKTASEYSQNSFEFLTYATVIYLVLNLLILQFMLFLENKYRVPGLIEEQK